MTEQPIKKRYLTRNVILGWGSLIMITGLAVFGFQFVQARNANLTNTPEQIPRISVAELKSKMDAKSSLVVVDVRSKEEYEQMHIAGSISMPTAEISQRYEELKGYKLVVTYCTWLDEAASAGAALTLRQLGITNVKPLQGGLTVWKEVGYPVDGTAK